MRDRIRLSCEAHGLRLAQVLSEGGRASAFVVKVLTADGVTGVLKQGIPQRPGELAAIRSWQPTGYSTTLLADYGRGLFLIAFLEGSSLRDAIAAGYTDFVELGEMLAKLHACEPAPSLEPTHVAPADVRGWPGLEDFLSTASEEAANLLGALARDQPVVLHGDLSMDNVLLVEGRPKVIDPAGLHGPAAMDLAQLAVMTYGRTGQRILGALLDGYRQEPAGLRESVIFFVALYLSMSRGPRGSAPLRNQLEALLAEVNEQVGGLFDRLTGAAR